MEKILKLFDPSTIPGAILCSVVAGIILSLFIANKVTKKKHSETVITLGGKNRVNYKSKNKEVKKDE